jgi:hypothetical protein
MKRCIPRGPVVAFAVALLVFLAHGACGGGDVSDQMGGRGNGGGQPSPAAAPVPADVAQACGSYAGAVCAKLLACSPAGLKADFGDMGTCTARKTIACTAGAVAPGAQITAALLNTCVGELRGAACDAFATHGVAACLLKGRRGDGDGCASDFQCASAFCKRTRGINCGSCTPLGRTNSPCTDSNECGPGLECSNSGACLAPSAPGMPCSDAQPCKFGSYCAGQTCAAQVEMAGAACQARDSCASHRGLVCSQNQCAAIAFARSGQACGGQGILLCEASGDCVLGQSAMGTCSMVASDGQSCAAGQSCLAPAECLSGICDIPRGTDTGFCN